MKLTYWVANRLTDRCCYSIRKLTKKAVVEELKSHDKEDYGEPHKITVEYDSAFDLLNQCLQEGSINEGTD